MSVSSNGSRVRALKRSRNDTGGMVLKRALTSAAFGTAALAVALFLAGCAGASPPKPTTASAVLAVAPDANPDETGRASPVVVRVYELKQADAFNSAGYFALMEHEQATLGDSLVHREEFELSPGETRTLTLDIPPGVRYLAAIAGYRQIRSATWKASAAVPDQWLHGRKHPHRVSIRVGRAAVTIVE